MVEIAKIFSKFLIKFVLKIWIGIGYGFCLEYNYNLVFLVWKSVHFGRCRSGMSYSFRRHRNVKIPLKS